jgi:hypothetical protein
LAAPTRIQNDVEVALLTFIGSHDYRAIPAGKPRANATDVEELFSKNVTVSISGEIVVGQFDIQNIPG